MRSVFMTLVMLLTLQFLFSKAEFIEPLTSTPLRPFSINQDYATAYLFSFHLPSAIDFGASIEIEFPFPYELPSTCKAFLKIQERAFTQHSCEKTSSSKYLIKIGKIVPGDYQLAFENIKNPSVYPASSNFKIRTYFNQGVLVDANEYFEAVPFLPSPIISSNAYVTNLGYNKVSLGSKFDFNFTLNKGLKKGDSIKFNFPEGFFFVKPACFHRNSGGYAHPETLYNNRMVICQSFPHDIPANSQHIVTIIGIVNPDHAGFYQGFSLETMEGSSPNIYERNDVILPVQIVPGSVSVQIKSESLLKAANTTHMFDLLFENEIPMGREVWIRIPAGFRYLATECVLLRPLQPELGSTLLYLVANKTGYVIQGFSGIGANQLVSVQVEAENPFISANYEIKVFSFSPEYAAKIDEGSSNILIQDQFGSSKFLKSHSLRFTRRLKHGETGPLEFTFFLNEPLPPTIPSKSEGKIVIDIRPQIPDPGNVVCFFYKTILGTCSWNVSDPSLTRVTIYTPLTDAYFQSEIPITITSEIDQGTTGVTLPELIRRYKFYIYFYKNQEKDFHEVYYEDYIPEPINMPEDWLTYTFAPMQYEEYSYLKIVWRNNYLDLGTNYFVELEFDHNNNKAWDYNLGWDSVEWYRKHTLPCIIENLGDNYKCLLKPGGALNTKSTIRVVGLSNITKSKGDADPTNPVFHLPKIKFGTQDRAFMRFTLYQNTPGETSHSIPIMYRDINFVPLNSAIVVEEKGLEVRLEPDAKVSEDRSLTFSLPSNSADLPSFVIFNFPAIPELKNAFSLKNGIVSCGSSKQCLVFTEPVNWIVYDSSKEVSSPISISLGVHTPPYVETLSFHEWKVSRTSQISDRKQGDLILEPGKNLAINFKPSSANIENNWDSFMLLDIGFTLASPLPSDSSIMLTFGKVSIPSGDNFFCQVDGLKQLDPREIICEQGPSKSNQIKIYNSEATSAKSKINIVVQCKTPSKTGASSAVTATLKVETYYHRDSTKVVDSQLPQTASIQLAYENFTSVSLTNDRSGQVVRASSSGKFTLQLTSNLLETIINPITVSFPNSFEWDQRDVLMCRSQDERKSCKKSSSSTQTIAEIDADIKDGQNTLTVSTDYTDSPIQKGIKAPNIPKWYPVFTTFKSSTGKEEKVGDFVYVYPSQAPDFSVEAVPFSAEVYALYTFTIKLNNVLNSNADSTERGRVFIDFPVGDEQFEVDLGTGKKTGEYIGCNIQGLQTHTSLHCRIILSPGANLPTSVEVIGFDQVTTPATTNIIIRVGKIKNPKTTTGEYKFVLRTEHVKETTGVPEITPQEYTTYSLWHFVQAKPSSIPTDASPIIATFEPDASPGQKGKSLSLALFSKLELTAGDYYIYEFPSEIVLDSKLTPPSSDFDLALSFPDIGWAVFRISSTVASDSNDKIINIQQVTVPEVFPLSGGYDINAIIWKDKTLSEFVTHKTNSFTGTVIISKVTPYNIQVKFRPGSVTTDGFRSDVLVEFTLASKIPSTGTIEINFPATFIPHANCRSAYIAGSKLTGQQDQIACEVRDSSWIITNFPEVTTFKTDIKIFGSLDLPSEPPSSTLILITTYYNQATSLTTDGLKIDSSVGYNFNFADITKTLGLDSSFTSIVNEGFYTSAASSTFHPFTFDFNLDNPVDTKSDMELSSQAFSGDLPKNGVLVCYIINLSTLETIACEISSFTGPTIKFMPLEKLNNGVNYRGVVTTVFADEGKDGIKLSDKADIYSISLKTDSGTSQQASLAFFEILTEKFKNVVVKNYMIASPDEDIIDITLEWSPTSSFDTIVIELPTIFNDTDLYEEDLGQQLADNDEKDCDIISPASITISCFFQRGNRIAGTPASIVVYKFDQTSTKLRFAFTVKNPSIPQAPVVVPITIYTVKDNAKVLYQYIEKAIVIPAIISSSSETIAPSYFDSSSSLTLNLGLAHDLKSLDYYIIKIPQTDLKPKTSSKITIKSSKGSSELTFSSIILRKNGFVLISSDKSDLKSVNSPFSVSIADVFVPSIGHSKEIVGFIAYFSLMASDKIIYPLSSTGFKASDSVSVIASNSLLEITIKTYYKDIQSVIIQLGSSILDVYDCYESLDSEIRILQCTLYKAENKIVIFLENSGITSNIQNLILRVSTGVPNTAITTKFTYYLYASFETDPLVTTKNKVYSFEADHTFTIGTSSTGGSTFELVDSLLINDRVIGAGGFMAAIRFKLVTPLAVDGMAIIIQLPASEFDLFKTNLKCTARTYSSLLTYDETVVDCTVGSGTQGNVVTLSSFPFKSSNTFYELIVDSQLSSTLSFNPLEDMVASLIEGDMIAASNLDYMTSSSGDSSTIVIGLTTKKKINSFPNTLIEMEITSPSSGIIKTGTTATGRETKCGVAGLSKRSISNTDLRCILINSSPPRIRVENYDSIAENTAFYIIVYDLIIEMPSQYLNARLIVFDNANNILSQIHLSKQIVTRTPISTPLQDTGILDPSELIYGRKTSFKSSLTFSASNCKSCMIIGRDESKTLKLIDTSSKVKIKSIIQTILIDSVNNIFIILKPNPDLLDSSYEFLFESDNIRTPYDTENLSYSIELEFFSDHQSTRIIELQTSFSPLGEATITLNPKLKCSLSNLNFGKQSNFDCVLTANFDSTNFPSAIKIDFSSPPGKTPNVEVYPFPCSSASLGLTTKPPKKSLACSRRDSSKDKISIFFTGFKKTSSNTLTFVFKGTILDVTKIELGVTFLVLIDQKEYPAKSVPIKMDIGSISTVFDSKVSPLAKFEVGTIYQKKVEFSSIPAIRVATQIPTPLIKGSQISVSISTSSLPAKVLCTLRDMKTFDIPILAQCSSDTSVKTTYTYTLTLLTSVPTGRFLLEITADPSVGSFSLPDKATLVIIEVPTGTTQDFTYIHPAPSSFKTFNIIQRNKIASSNSQLDLKLSLPTNLGAGTTEEESLLVLEFPSPPYDPKLGEKALTADAIPFYNGMFLPSALPDIFKTQATLHFGNTIDQPLIIMALSADFPGISEQLFGLAYLENPTLNKGLSIRVSIIKNTWTKSSGMIQTVVLYQACYLHYSNTIASSLKSSPMTVKSAGFSSLFPTSKTDFTIEGIAFEAPITDYKVYVKLKNQAQGLDYTRMEDTNGIECSDYNVQWHKSGYLIFLSPKVLRASKDIGDIKCSGFFIGYNIEKIDVEVGLHIEKNGEIYTYTFQQAIDSNKDIQAGSLIVDPKEKDFTTVNSINIYQITCNVKEFLAVAGGYMILTIPPELEIVSERLGHVQIRNLRDRTSIVRAVQAVREDSNIKIEGYETFDKEFQIDLFLRNKKENASSFVLLFYDANKNPVSKLTSASFDWPTHSVLDDVTFGPYLTDTVDVYAGETYQLLFNLTIKNTLSKRDGKFEIAFPEGFNIAKSEKYICKYSVDNGNHWLRSSCSMPSGSSILTIPLLPEFTDIVAGSKVLLIVTTDNPNSAKVGIIRPSDSKINTFNIKSKTSGSILESSFLPLIIFPKYEDVTVKWYETGANKEDTLVEISFVSHQVIDSNYYFQLELVTDDELRKVFPYIQGSTENRILGNCGYYISTESSLGNCFLNHGKPAKGKLASSPAKMKIANSNKIHNLDSVKLFIAKIKNPASETSPAGFVFSVMKPCRNDGFGCPVIRKRDYFWVASLKSSIRTLRSPSIGKTPLMENTVISFSLDLNLLNFEITDSAIIQVDPKNIILKEKCQSGSSNGYCINFPKIDWILYKTTRTLSLSTESIGVYLDNAIFDDRSHTLGFTVIGWIGTSRYTFNSQQPAYTPLVFDTSTIQTQADLGIQKIVRNFDNILKLSMKGIWNENVKKIMVNTPEDYPIDTTYFMCGTNLNNISSKDYIEFGCKPTGSKTFEIVIDTPWDDRYKDYNVVLYFKGFLDNNPANIGPKKYSTIASYADLTKNWVIHENTKYNFTVDKEPTPVIRNISLNLKSFNDRQARLSDFVEFYGAIWPNTPYNPTDPLNAITQILVQVDNEFAYPSVLKLICETKVIFREEVACKLKRNQGRTEILINMPEKYTNGPFLFRITNTQENLLFRAPNREGSFRYNLTYLNKENNPVEKGVSFMGISGEFVYNFIAQPMLKDDLAKTLYNVQFTTTGRVTPQGFFALGQPAQTEIVLLFQTEASGFPIDLGSGLESGSEISCIAVQGITVKTTGKLTCILIHGTQIIHTVIKITGYDVIPSRTNVIIFLDEIKTLAVGQTSRIKLEIRSNYSGSNEQLMFYNSLEFSPQKTTATSTIAEKPLEINGPSSAPLRDSSSYTFNFEMTDSLSAEDYIIIEFPEFGYERDLDYSGVEIKIASSTIGSRSYIMPKRNVIYIQLAGNLIAGQTVVSVASLSTPSFYLEGSLRFTIKTVKSSEVNGVFTGVLPYKSTFCQLFSEEQIKSTSQFIRVNENTYQISFKLDHKVPPHGSLAIIFDSKLYNLRFSDPTCELTEGFPSPATCVFELFNEQLARIKLNGGVLPKGARLKLNIVNVNNPVDSTQGPVIAIRSYFDTEIDTSKIICSKEIRLPPFLPSNLIKCPMVVEPELNNAGKVTDYLITVSCSTYIRNFTALQVQFPVGFEDNFNHYLSASCSIDQGHLLEPCSHIARTNIIQLLLSKPDSGTPIITRIRDIKNPSLLNEYGPFSIKLYQYGVLYGEIDLSKSRAQINIVRDQSITSNNNLDISVFPRNFGEKATYFFKVFGLLFSTVSPKKILVHFDTSFAKDLGPSLVCGTFTPQASFGESYALNYEELTDFEYFPCYLTDSSVLALELSSTAKIETGKKQDFFFFIRNVINPNIIDSTTKAIPKKTFSFKLTFVEGKTALAISQNDINIDFELPPSLLGIENVVASDTNILAQADYSLSMLARSNLPSSIVNKDYEIAISFPSDRYPTLPQQTGMVYSFPDYPKLQIQNLVFNFGGIFFIDALDPDLNNLGLFNIRINKITNPSTESNCEANSSGSPIRFGAQYLSRRYNLLYGRTYSIMDRKNCLNIGQFRRSIKVISPLYFRQGLVYTISIQLEEPASGLTLTPHSNSFSFEPKSVRFDDYKSQSASLKVFVPRNLPEDEYIIKWQKNETLAPGRYLEVQDTNIVVVAENASPSLTPMPNVRIGRLRYVWIGKYPTNVSMSLDQEPAEELTVHVELKRLDSELLGSVEGEEIFSEFPIKLVFHRGESTKRFYVFARQGAKDNALVYTLDGTNANAYEQSLPDSPFTIKTGQSQQTVQIFSVQQILAHENNITCSVTVSDLGTLYYLAIIKNGIPPTVSQVIQGKVSGISSDFCRAGSVEVKNIDLAVQVEINKLHSDAEYQVYFVLMSTYGEYSNVTIQEVKTSKRTEGAMIFILIKGIIQESVLIDALCAVLSIPKSRFSSQGVNFDGTHLEPKEQFNKYKIVLIPDAHNNDPSPFSIANKLLTQAKTNDFASLVPQFETNYGFRIEYIKGNFVDMSVYFCILDIGYYSVEIQVNLMNPGRVYGIAIEKELKFDNAPTNFQISKGLMPNNTAVEKNLFKINMTDDDDGKAMLYFDELKDFTEYDIYITAGNNLPYEPCDLLKDNKTRQLNIKTPKNPNLGTMNQAIELYSQFYEQSGGSSSHKNKLVSLYLFILLFTIQFII